MLQPVPAMCPTVLLGQTRGEHVMLGIQSLYHAYTCSKIRHITRIVHIMPQLSLNVLYRQDIQYGANCPIVAHNSSIKLDEFEYDVTSVRPGAHICIFVHMCSSKSPIRTHPSSQYFVVQHASRRSRPHPCLLSFGKAFSQKGSRCFGSFSFRWHSAAY